jgi:hypothetical protein
MQDPRFKPQPLQKKDTNINKTSILKDVTRLFLSSPFLFYTRVCKQLKYSTATNKKSTQQLKYLTATNKKSTQQLKYLLLFKKKLKYLLFYFSFKKIKIILFD